MAPEARSWAALGGRELVAAQASSGSWRWGTELIAGARLSKGRGRGGQLGRREPKGKTYSREDAPDVRAGWAKGRVGRKVGRAERKEKEFLN